MKAFFLFIILFLLSFTGLIAEILHFKSYQVQSKDTLFSISQKFKITTKDIYRWNEKKIKDPRLFVGESLRIPVFKTSENIQTKNLVQNSQQSSTNFLYPLETKSKIEIDFSNILYHVNNMSLLDVKLKVTNII